MRGAGVIRWTRTELVEVPRGDGVGDMVLGTKVTGFVAGYCNLPASREHDKGYHSASF